MSWLQNSAMNSRLERARDALDHTDAAIAFAGLCEIFDVILASRSESVVVEALLKLPPPLDCLRVLRTESGFKVKSVSVVSAVAQCHTLINYIVSFSASLPRMTLAERFDVMTQCQLQRCMNSGNSLRLKKRCHWLLARLRLWLLRWPTGQVQNLRKRQFLLACLLHEPESRIRQIWYEHTFWFHFNYAKRLLHLQNRPESSAYLKRFNWPDKDDYHRLTQSSSASRVLVTIHMGDFYGAFRVIASVSDSGRHVISLRREETSDHGMQHFSSDRIAHRVLYHQQQQAAGIVSALRRGNHTLATLFDLREDFGNTVVVNFLGQRARFVQGPAQLAILGRSHIFPFVCFESQGCNYIEMAPVIDTRLHTGESLQHATARITQSLVGLAEGWIRRYPAQWKYLTALPAYFEPVA